MLRASNSILHSLITLSPTSSTITTIAWLMDPVSIAGAVGPTLKILYTVTTTLYSFITSAKKVDKTLESLNVEVRGLTRVLEDIETYLKDITIAQTSHATARKDGVWGPIYSAIQDTQRTIEALQEVLDRLGPPSKVTNGLKKTVKQIQLDFNSDEVSNIRSRIQCHSTILRTYILAFFFSIQALFGVAIGSEHPVVSLPHFLLCFAVLNVNPQGRG